MKRKIEAVRNEAVREERTGRAAFMGRVLSVTSPLTPTPGGEAQVRCDDGKMLRVEGLSEDMARAIAARFGLHVVLIGTATWSGRSRLRKFRADYCLDDPAIEAARKAADGEAYSVE